MVKIGIFDGGVVMPSKVKSVQYQLNECINNLFEVLPKIESLGFSRFWLGEHYGPNCAWRNPEILIALLCMATKKIRVGVAGVLVKLYPSLLVAQNYKLLEYLFIERIDLAFSRGVPSEEILKHFNVDNNNEIQVFSSKVNEILKLISNNEINQQLYCAAVSRQHP